MKNAQSELDEDPEDTFADAKEEQWDSDDDASMYSNSMDSRLSYDEYGSQTSRMEEEELELERMQLEEDNRIMEDRYTEDQEGFRIRLDPANFQEQLMNEAGPHTDGMLKRVELIKRSLETERDGRELRDTAICSDKLMSFLHAESLSEETDDLLDQL